MDKISVGKPKTQEMSTELFDVADTEAIDLLAFMIVRVPLLGMWLGGLYIFLLVIIETVLVAVTHTSVLGLLAGRSSNTLYEILIPALVIGFVAGIFGGTIIGEIVGVVTGFLMFIITKLFMTLHRTKGYSRLSTASSALCSLITVTFFLSTTFMSPFIFSTRSSNPILIFVWIIIPAFIATAGTTWIVWRKTSAIERGTDRPKRKKKHDKEVTS